VAFGLAIVGSLGAALSYSGEAIEFNDDLIMGTVVYEMIAGGIAFAILKTRGWKWSDFAIHASRGATILGVIMAIVLFVFGYVFEAIFGKVPVVLSAGLLPILLVSLLNPVFEELLVLGYVVQSMRKAFGLTTAFNVSLALRILYHLYQGPLAVVPIAVMALVFTLVYVKMGRLWPVIVSHALLDFLGLTVDT
jgi:membrane protease YdiL (CAAX protease family)